MAGRRFAEGFQAGAKISGNITTAMPPVRLIRRDPARNLARWYVAEVMPDLFGGAVLVRRWGRIGCGGQEMREWFDSRAGANAAQDALIRAKTRKGYCVTPPPCQARPGASK